MDYGRIIKNLREENNLSQRELAEVLGIKRSSYNQFEQQYDIIPIVRLNQVANYFDVSIDYLLGLNDKKKYDKSINDISKDILKVRIKQFRKDNKITQMKLAEFLNTAQPVITNYEKGITIMPTPFLYSIAKKYGISVDYLLGKIDYLPSLKK